jgi:inosose dehydratase
MFKIACHSLTWGNYYKDGDYPIELVLKEVSEAGFEGIEIFEPISRLGSPQGLKELLDKYNLKLATLSGNLNLSSPDNKDMEEAKEKVRFLNSLKIGTFMLCGGWIKSISEKTDDNFRKFSERLEELAGFAQEMGVQIAFHPHLGCIVETKEDIERLFKDVELTGLCLDTAHLTAAGSNPMDVIKRYSKELKLVHLKDWDAQEKRFVELGKGIIGDALSGIIKEIGGAGYSGWLVCELDETRRTPEESARINRKFLKDRGV